MCAAFRDCRTACRDSSALSTWCREALWQEGDNSTNSHGPRKENRAGELTTRPVLLRAVMRDEVMTSRSHLCNSCRATHELNREKSV